MATLTREQIEELSLDEASLARQARVDAQAFAELYRRHVGRVYRYHLAHTGEVKDAEDLTSQTFMAALEGIRSYRNAGSFAAWLMGIAVRKQAMFFRSRKPVELPFEQLAEIPDHDPPTDQLAFRQLRIRQVHEALRQLSPDRAEAVALCFFGGLTCLEAGHVLRKSEAAVKMLLSRALNDLRLRTSLALEMQDE